MYERAWDQTLLERLDRADEQDELNAGEKSLLVHVELGLRLLELLNLDGESVLSLWVVLSGLPIPDSRLGQLSEEQRRAIANARVLLGYWGASGWEWDLRRYADIDSGWRCYDLDSKNLGQQFVKRTQNQHKSRIIEYDKHLHRTLPHRTRSIHRANAGKVSFSIPLSEGPREVSVNLPAELIQAANVPIFWFQKPRPRQPIKITRQQILDTAEFVEGQECKNRINQDNPRNWHDFVIKTLRYRSLVNQEQQKKRGDEQDTLILEGVLHLAGMVASGKSSLMDLIAVHLVQHTDCRVTLVVPDTAGAMDRAHYFNRLLCEPNAPPIATALLGRSQRDKHLKRVYSSQIYLRENHHSALRWLNSACALQALESVSKLPAVLQPGSEPCDNLSQDFELKNGGVISKRVSCPLFATCPVQQVYRDMPAARIWITTPGALGQARLPSQAERRDIKLDELVYEQSDLVIFDEIDLHQTWFDNLCAPQVSLADSNRGMLDELDIQVSQGWASRRVQPLGFRRWLQAERNSVNVLSHMFSFLNDHRRIEKEIQRDYFTAFKRFYRLARLISGSVGEAPTEKREIESWQFGATGVKAIRYFRTLLDGDPMDFRLPQPNDTDYQTQFAIHRLSRIVERIVSKGDTLGTQTEQECREWLTEFIFAENAPLQINLLKDLAQQLEFALTVSALDHNMHIVLSEWYRRPESILLNWKEAQRYARTPADLAQILPVPPTGSLFGFYYRKEDATRTRNSPIGERVPDESRKLAAFEYASIGRSYLIDYSRLRTDLDGLSGPNMLAMSGTSWLPDSSRLHFMVEPKGVLQPEARSEVAISKSRFMFAPQFQKTPKGLQPINVSGEADMLLQVRRIAASLAGNDKMVAGSLRAELEELEKLGQTQNEWSNRKRILLFVNSYEQANIVAQEIATRMYERREQDRVVCVKSNVSYDKGDEWEWVPFSRLSSGDVSSFSATSGEILVAPLQAIGRGYNILAEAVDKRNIAAIGSVYFLTRPMPQPFDAQDMVRELNHFALTVCANTNHTVWQGQDGLYAKGNALRDAVRSRQRDIENRSGYSTLDAEARRDLAASTAGIIIQACGRLLRGGVPFRAYFADAKWAPNSAWALTGKSSTVDTPVTSLLVAMIHTLDSYVNANEVGKILYGSLSTALKETKNLLQSQ